MGLFRDPPVAFASANDVIVTTIADVRTTLAPAANEVYYVRDRLQEGHFYYDAADTTSADNTGTVLVNGSGQRFKRIIGQAGLDVRWFGAKGDGTTDDSAAIQNAIDSAAPGPIIFPSGTYKVSNLTSGSRKTFIGYGATLATTGTAPIMTVDDDNTTFANLVFAGNSASIADADNGQKGVKIDGYADVRFIDCEVRNMKGDGVYYAHCPDFGQGIQWIGGTIHHNVVGMRFAARGEYSSVTSANLYENGTGLIIGVGNVKLTAANVTLNTVGVKLVQGDNDSHVLIILF